MLVCDECRKSSEEVPLSVKGVVYTGSPNELFPKKYIVFSVLCQKCDIGEEGNDDIRKSLGENDGSKKSK